MRSILTILFIVLSVSLFAQPQNDRRAFQGTVVSKKTVERDIASGEKVSESDEQTTIKFTARTITIGYAVYDVVTREFDGSSTNTFKCTIRRGTFTIIYEPDQTLAVIDHDDELRTEYYSLTEQK